MRDYSGLTWTGEDGSINYIRREVTDYTVELLENVERDIKLEGRGTLDDNGDVDAGLIEALRDVRNAIRILKEYINWSLVEDKEYAATQRGE